MAKGVDYEQRGELALHVCLFSLMGAWVYSVAGWLTVGVIAAYYLCYTFYAAWRCAASNPEVPRD